MVGANASQLRAVTAEVQATRVQSINVQNADRECLVLLQLVGELDETSTPEQVDLQRGAMLRQVAVSIASFPPDAAQARELEGVRAELNMLPVGAARPAGRPRRAAADRDGPGLKERAPDQHPAHRPGEALLPGDQPAPLDANQRSQNGLSILVAVVLGLGILGVVVVTWRSRSDHRPGLRRAQGRGQPSGGRPRRRCARARAASAPWCSGPPTSRWSPTRPG